MGTNVKTSQSNLIRNNEREPQPYRQGRWKRTMRRRRPQRKLCISRPSAWLEQLPNVQPNAEIFGGVDGNLIKTNGLRATPLSHLERIEFLRGNPDVAATHSRDNFRVRFRYFAASYPTCIFYSWPCSRVSIQSNQSLPNQSISGQ